MYGCFPDAIAFKSDDDVIESDAKILVNVTYTSHVNIQSICYECGFNNFSNFSRFFKLHYKQTPKNFREKMNKSLSE